MSSAATPGYSSGFSLSVSTVLKWLAIAGLAVLGLVAYVMAAGRYLNYSEASTRAIGRRGDG